MPLPNPGMSFTPFDPLPASDLNDMVENIEALNDSTGLDLAINSLSSFSNPYKFSARSDTQLQTGNGAYSGALVFEDEDYDTNNNYNAATGVYTAAVAGFYHFDVQMSFDSASNDIFIGLFKNGSEIKRGGRSKGSAENVGVNLSCDLPLAATNTVDVRAFGTNNTTDEANSGVANFWNGHLFSRT